MAVLCAIGLSMILGRVGVSCAGLALSLMNSGVDDRYQRRIERGIAIAALCWCGSLLVTPFNHWLTWIQIAFDLECAVIIAVCVHLLVLLPAESRALRRALLIVCPVTSGLLLAFAYAAGEDPEMMINGPARVITLLVPCYAGIVLCLVARRLARSCEPVEKSLRACVR